ncbi:MAG: hypothetical protein ABL949_10835 [Fimbriimonadaceae bacterium]
MIIFLDLFLASMRAGRSPAKFWRRVRQVLLKKNNLYDRGTAGLIGAFHGSEPSAKHALSMRIVLFSVLQNLFIIPPGWVVISCARIHVNMMPSVAYYCAFLLVLEVASSLSILHLSFNAGKHWTGLFSLIPFAILIVGLCATGITSLLLVGILFAMFWWGFLFLVHQFLRFSKVFIGLAVISGLLIPVLLPVYPHLWRESDVIFTDRDHVTKKTIPVTVKSVVSSRPNVIMCMGGGGSRAAIFNGLILERLWWLRPPMPSQELVNECVASLPENIRPFVAEGAPKGQPSYFYPGRILLLDTKFISSISGGSLAAAYWNQATAKFDKNSTNDDQSDSLLRRAQALKKFFQPDENYVRLEDGDIALSRGERLPQELADRLEKNPTVSAMKKNFLAAVICGAFNPGSSRVDMLTEMWERSFGWNHDSRSLRISDLKSAEEQSVIPFSIFNTTRTKNGERMAITNLDQKHFKWRRNFGVDPAQKDLFGGLRFNTSPGRVTTHSWFNQYWDPTLAHAVFASSGFPYGFPIHQFQPTTDKTRSNEAPEGSTDGGVLENTGANTALALIRKFGSSMGKAFVFQIDTSELPSNPGPSPQLFFNITEASNTRKRVERIQEQSLLDYFVDEMGDIMQGPSGAPTKQAMFNVTVEGLPREYVYGFLGKNWAWCNVRAGEFDNEHVPTSWHLSDRSRRILYRMAYSEVVTKSLEGSCLEYVYLLLGKPLNERPRGGSPASQFYYTVEQDW